MRKIGVGAVVVAVLVVVVVVVVWRSNLVGVFDWDG